MSKPPETTDVPGAAAAETRRPTAPRWPLLRTFAWLWTAGGSLATGLALLWPDDLTSSSRVFVLFCHAAFMSAVFLFHIALSLAIVLGFSILARARRLRWVAFVVCVAAVAPEAVRWCSGTTKLGAEGATLRVMSVNLMYGRVDAARLREQVERVKPDVILFQ